MENSQNARYVQYQEKNDYFLDPNQTLTKEKIQELNIFPLEHFNEIDERKKSYRIL